MDKKKLRPCFVKGEKALFHCWQQRAFVVPPSIAIGGHDGGQVSIPFGIVEYEDGSVKEVYPYDIVFADRDVNIAEKYHGLRKDEADPK